MSAALHLVRAALDMRDLHRWIGERGLLRDGVVDEGHALHHLLAETFGPRQIQPFRLMAAPGGRAASLYGYATAPAAALTAQARATALPEHLAVLPADRLESKAMPEDWALGRRVGFDVRGRPVRRGKGANGRRGVERDAFAVRAGQAPPGAFDGTRESVYLDWLGERLARAAVLERDACRLASFRRTRTIRGAARRKPSERPDAVLHGVLRVVDAAAFGDLLQRGVGRHRAYGYGMLLLRPAAPRGRGAPC